MLVQAIRPPLNTPLHTPQPQHWTVISRAGMAQLRMIRLREARGFPAQWRPAGRRTRARRATPQTTTSQATWASAALVLRRPRGSVATSTPNRSPASSCRQQFRSPPSATPSREPHLRPSRLFLKVSSDSYYLSSPDTSIDYSFCIQLQLSLYL